MFLFQKEAKLQLCGIYIATRRILSILIYQFSVSISGEKKNVKSEQLTLFHYHFHHYQNEQAIDIPQEGLKAK